MKTVTHIMSDEKYAELYELMFWYNAMPTILRQGHDEFEEEVDQTIESLIPPEVCDLVTAQLVAASCNNGGLQLVQGRLQIVVTADGTDEPLLTITLVGEGDPEVKPQHSFKNVGELRAFLRTVPAETEMSATYSTDVESGQLVAEYWPDSASIQFVGSAEDV